MAAKKKAVPSNIDARLTQLRRDFEALQEDVKGLAGDVGMVASERAQMARSATSSAERIAIWAEENADALRGQVREQPITALLIAGGVGAFLGAIFLRR